MVQGFAEQSGGRLRLKSKKDVGTTAELWLPATEAEDEPKSAEAPLPTAASGPQELVVLAVDDDVLVRMGTAAMLEDLGHTVREANSGEEALKILAQGTKIDLVVTDQAMPRMTGVQLAEAILADRPDLPIILATGYAELPAGLGSTLPRLSKPFTQEQLANALKEAIGGTKPVCFFECILKEINSILTHLFFAQFRIGGWQAFKIFLVFAGNP